jgi:hypothetical protein
MSPELRKRYDAEEQERVDRRDKIFEHIKYNASQNKPGKFVLDDVDVVWDVQWDKMAEDRSKYPAVRTNVPPPSKNQDKVKAVKEESSS